MPVEMYQVHSAISSVVGPLQREVNALERKLREMEDEMANVANAIQQMHQALAHGLNNIHTSNHQLIQIQQASATMTLQQFTAANTALVATSHQVSGMRTESKLGFATMGSELQLVDKDVQKMTQALVQMEVIRLLNEAKGPVQRLRGFGEEIDQRFSKAVENVFFVRAQHDQLLGTAMGQYEHKLRLIGEHIYLIYEQDFRAFAEEPLTEAADEHIDLAMKVDERRLQERARALDTNIAMLGETILAPLLDAQRTFEETLAGTFATNLHLDSGEALLPASVTIRSSAGTERLHVVTAARVERQEGGDCGFQLRNEAYGQPLAELIESSAPQVLAGLTTTKMPRELLEAVKDELALLAEEGMLDPKLLPGYAEYLDRFGLEVVNQGEISPAAQRGGES